MNPRHVRWMIRMDMPEVLRIENECYPQPWIEDDFIHILRQRNHIGMVVEEDQTKVVGFVIYSLDKTYNRIVNIAVDPTYQRQGIGSLILDKLKSKLCPSRRSKIILDVRESAMGCILFLKSQGFMATKVQRNLYGTEDGYEMVYKTEERVDAQGSL